MIYEENPTSFDEILNGLTKLQDKINSLNWKFELQFPSTIWLKYCTDFAIESIHAHIVRDIFLRIWLEPIE